MPSMIEGWSQIDKKFWQILGGLENPRLCRVADSRGYWKYYSR